MHAPTSPTNDVRVSYNGIEVVAILKRRMALDHLCLYSHFVYLISMLFRKKNQVGKCLNPSSCQLCPVLMVLLTVSFIVRLKSLFCMLDNNSNFKIYLLYDLASTLLDLFKLLQSLNSIYVSIISLFYKIFKKCFFKTVLSRPISISKKVIETRF